MSRSTPFLIAIIISLALSALALAYPPPGGGGGGTPPADPAIVFYDTKGGLVVMNADGARRTTVLKATSGNFAFPCWSPDGRSVCFGINATISGVLYRGLAALDVNVVSGTPVGSNFRMLVVTTGAFPFPSWSPDGTRIAYNFLHGIYSIPATGGTPTLLYYGNDVGLASIAWSPDSTHIAYAGGDNSTATVKVLNVADGSTFEVCSITGPDGMIPGQLDWGRTGGNKIVLHARPYSAPGSFIYTVEATPGASPQPVASSSWFPTWSPDDAMIAYTTGTSDSIVIRNLQTGAVTSTGGKGRFANWRRF